MVEWIDFIMIVLVLTNLALLSFKQLLNCIRMAAFQGVLVALVPLFFFGGFFNTKIILVSLATLLLKGVVFPYLFFRAFKKARINKEVEPFVSFKLSVIIGLFALLISFWLSRNLSVAGEFFSFLV
ncbi:MAG: hypothetical protein WC371_02580, partial [Parachlamydiales bacterium]